MTRRRVPPRYLRLVAPIEQPPEPAGMSAHIEPAETEVDRAIRPIVEAGRTIIAAGVAAIVDVSTDFGFAWDRDELRSAIADIVGRKLHDDVIAICIRDSFDRDAVARHLMYGDGRDAAVNAITNSVIQDVAKALLQYGCHGGLGDSRALRTAIRQIVHRKHPADDPRVRSSGSIAILKISPEGALTDVIFDSCSICDANNGEFTCVNQSETCPHLAAVVSKLARLVGRQIAREEASRHLAAVVKKTTV